MQGEIPNKISPARKSGFSRQGAASSTINGGAMIQLAVKVRTVGPTFLRAWVTSPSSTLAMVGYMRKNISTAMGRDTPLMFSPFTSTTTSGNNFPNPTPTTPHKTLQR